MSTHLQLPGVEAASADYELQRLWFQVLRSDSQIASSPKPKTPDALLGGSWVVISGVIIKVAMVITPMGLITPLITTHEPPSKP